METLQNLFSTQSILQFLAFIAKPILIFVICKILIGAFMKLSRKLLGKSKLESGAQGFTASAIRIALWAVCVIIVADSVGINTASLVTVLGVVSLALSLSFQSIMTNVFSGLTILISKPFSVGNYVEIAGVGGTVKDINLMRTTLVTPDKKIELIPNSDVCAGRITNYSLEPLRRVEIKISASYDAPTVAVQRAVMKVLVSDERVHKEDDFLPSVRLSAYNANDIEYTVRMWVNNAEYWNVYFDVLENIRESFAQNGIEFSYPHVVVHNEK